MPDPTSQAREIVLSADRTAETYGVPHSRIQFLISAIASALQVPAGCVRDDKGVDRKVLGTLPVTADGCVVVCGSEVYYHDHLGVRKGNVMVCGGGKHKGAFKSRNINLSAPDAFDLKYCYSTAALSARGST